MCLAKSLGGGLMPIGAFITTAAVWNKAYGSMEKCTSTPPPSGATAGPAAGLAVIDTILKESCARMPPPLGATSWSSCGPSRSVTPSSRRSGPGLFIGLE